MDNIYIFILYEGRFDANFEREYFMQIFFTEGEKKETYLQCDIRSKFTSYISL